MAKLYGGQSQYLVKSEKLNKIALLAYLLILIIIWYFVFIKGFRYLLSLGGMLGMLISFGPLAWFAHHEFKKHEKDFFSFRRGRKGEGAIWYKLKKLSDEYSVFQDLKLSPNAGNIDFAIVGPGGVYALEVKSHSGNIDFNGQELTKNGRTLEKDFLKQAKGEALQIHNFLKENNIDIYVKPIVIFSGHANIRFGLKPIEDVYVIGKNFLYEFFNSENKIDFPKLKIEELLIQKLNLQNNKN